MVGPGVPSRHGGLTKVEACPAWGRRFHPPQGLLLAGPSPTAGGSAVGRPGCQQGPAGGDCPISPSPWAQGVSEAAQLQGLRYSGRPSGLLSKYRCAQAILGHCITQASRLGSCPNSCIEQSSSPPQYSLWLSFPRTQVYGHQNETAHKAVCSRAWADPGPQAKKILQIET